MLGKSVPRTRLALIGVLLTLLFVPATSLTVSAHVHSIPNSLKPIVIDTLTQYDDRGQIGISVIFATQDYWTAESLNPSGYGLNPNLYQTFIFIEEIHVGELPGYGSPTPDFMKMSTLTVNASSDGQNTTTVYHPAAIDYVVQSVHHTAVAIEFPIQQLGGALTIPSNATSINLQVAGLESYPAVNEVNWTLPITYGASSSGGAADLADPLGLSTGTVPLSILAVFPLVGGLLVYFSPCFLEMTSVYLALIAGIRVSEIADNKDSTRFRLRLLGAALLFVGGFASIYVAAGADSGIRRFGPRELDSKPAESPIQAHRRGPFDLHGSTGIRIDTETLGRTYIASISESQRLLQNWRFVYAGPDVRMSSMLPGKPCGRYAVLRLEHGLRADRRTDDARSCRSIWHTIHCNRSCGWTDIISGQARTQNCEGSV